MDATDRKLLDRMQRDFPLEPRPFAALGRELGLGEQEVLGRVRALAEAGLIRRIGPVLNPEKLGRVGTLAAMAVPPERLEEVAAAVSASDAVTHNYLRVPRRGRCPYNLWFTLSGGSQEALEEASRAIAGAAGLPARLFPSRRKFKIGVRFALSDEDSDG